jgi:hypothetical protein
MSLYNARITPLERVSVGHRAHVADIARRIEPARNVTTVRAISNQRVSLDLGASVPSQPPIVGSGFSSRWPSTPGASR